MKRKWIYLFLACMGGLVFLFIIKYVIHCNYADNNYTNTLKLISSNPGNESVYFLFNNLNCGINKNGFNEVIKQISKLPKDAVLVVGEDKVPRFGIFPDGPYVWRYNRLKIGDNMDFIKNYYIYTGPLDVENGDACDSRNVFNSACANIHVIWAPIKKIELGKISSIMWKKYEDDHTSGVEYFYNGKPCGRDSVGFNQVLEYLDEDKSTKALVLVAPKINSGSLLPENFEAPWSAVELDANLFKMILKYKSIEVIGTLNMIWTELENEALDAEQERLTGRSVHKNDIYGPAF